MSRSYSVIIKGVHVQIYLFLSSFFFGFFNIYLILKVFSSYLIHIFLLCLFFTS